MTHTLQTRYKTRQINERLRRADNLIINENRQAQLLIEAMDERDLQQANAIVYKFRKIKGKGLKSLDAAIGNAETQLNKYTGSGPLTKAWTKLKSVVGIDNPLVKFMTFANALEQGFQQLPSILNTFVDIETVDKEKSLAEAIPDVEKQKDLINNILKALAPKGFFGAFKKIPYLNKEVFAQELLTVPTQVLANIVGKVNSGPTTQQIADDLKTSVGAQGNAETRTTEPSDPTTKTSSTTGTAPSQATVGSAGTTPTGETPPRKIRDVDKKVFQELKDQLIDAAGNEQRAKAILKLLADEGKLTT